MKLLEKETPAVATKARVFVAPRPVARPRIAVRARVVAKPARRQNAAIETALNRVVAFAAIVGLVYVGSTLGGYVMLERARQSARHGEERAAYALLQVQASRTSINALTSPATLRGWALAHGFVPAQGTMTVPVDAPARGGTLVAQR